MILCDRLILFDFFTILRLHVTCSRVLFTCTIHVYCSLEYIEFRAPGGHEPPHNFSSRDYSIPLLYLCASMDSHCRVSVVC